MKYFLALLFVAFSQSLSVGQNLPDAPSAPQPTQGFGKTIAPAAKSASSLIVSESEAASHVLTRPQQIYPALASVNKVEGDVVVEATIDSNGNVSAVNLVSGPPMLSAAAVQYVKQWIFRPFYAGETRVPAVARVTVHYSLFTSQADREMQKHFLETYWPAWRAGEDALNKQDYVAAQHQFEIARSEAAKQGQVNWQELANALARLGAVEYRQKHYPAAEPYLLQALQLEQNHREAEAPEIADALGNLGQVYMAENQFGKAEPILLKAVEIYDAELQDTKALPATIQSAKRHRVLDLFMLASLNQELSAGDQAVRYCDMVVEDAPHSLAKDDAILVIRTCETVYRKNLRYGKSRDAEKTAEALQ